MESSPETGSKHSQSARRGTLTAVAATTTAAGDAPRLGASFDEIMGYVRIKDLSASITPNKVRGHMRQYR